MSSLSGVIVIHKQAGMTSHDCVARVRRYLRTKKVGHTGTLDPDVTGVLPICLGQATRIVEYLQDLPKTYEVTLRLGTATTTEDASGDVVKCEPVDPDTITEERVQAVFRQFEGEIEQVPPMYSAVKVNGKRLYQLARQGVVVERQARTVSIYDLHLYEISCSPNVEISFRCRCSKGTYIRTLCVDIGEALGYPAHMARLIRSGSGPFTLDDAISLERLEELSQSPEGVAAALIPPAEALAFLPRYDVGEERKAAVLNGLETALFNAGVSEGKLIRLFAGEQFLGIHRVCQGPKGYYAKPEKVFQVEV